MFAGGFEKTAAVKVIPTTRLTPSRMTKIVNGLVSRAGLAGHQNEHVVRDRLRNQLRQAEGYKGRSSRGFVNSLRSNFSKGSSGKISDRVRDDYKTEILNTAGFGRKPNPSEHYIPKMVRANKRAGKP
jgi:hypothetical protein